jgi:hypothetical protein
MIEDMILDVFQGIGFSLLAVIFLFAVLIVCKRGPSHKPVPVDGWNPTSQESALGLVGGYWVEVMWIAENEVVTGEQEDEYLPTGWYEAKLRIVDNYGFFDPVNVTHVLPLPPNPTS